MGDSGPVTGGLPPAVRLLRPRQWVKNVFVLAALVFAGRLTDHAAVIVSLRLLLGFCLLSSALYIINDLRDAEDDRRHPAKRDRPLASSRIGPAAALALAAVCLIGGLTLCAWTGPMRRMVLAVAVGFVALNLLYTFWAKHHMLVDVIFIAVGFVLRVVAGGVAIDVPVSRWIIASTFALCMFLGFAKRRCEVAQLGEREVAAAHRRTLWGYSRPLLDQFLSVSGGVAIVMYLIYSIDRPEPYLLYATPLVVFCVFRVSLLVIAGEVESPTAAVTRDAPFMIAFALWAAWAVVVVTWPDRLVDLTRAVEGWLTPG